MIPTQEFNLEIFADYFQIYVEDQSTQADHSAIWTDKAVEELLGKAHGLVAVGTYRNMTVPFTIKIFPDEPAMILGKQGAIDLLQECDLIIESGQLIVRGCTEYYPDALRIEVTPSLYRVRIYYANWHTLSEDGLDGDDFYEVHLWPSFVPQSKVRLLDRRKPPASWGWS